MSEGPASTARVSGLGAQLLAVISGEGHRAVVFHDLDEVPVGSAGYFTPGGRSALRDEKGWIHDGRRFEPQPERQYVFTSQSGPANDAKLAELIEEALVPEHSVLVAFRTEQQTESDWELGYSTSCTDLTGPEILGHRLDERELAELYFQIEAVGGLGESDAYSDLDKAIERLGEVPARELRAKAAQPELFELGPET